MKYELCYNIRWKVSCHKDYKLKENITKGPFLEMDKNNSATQTKTGKLFIDWSSI